MIKQREKKSLLSFKKQNLISLFDGIEFFLSFSIITHLSIFFFSYIDGRTSIIISSFIVLLSFFSRMFSSKITKLFFLLIKKNKVNFFLLISFVYLLPLIHFNNLINLSLFFFVISRIFVGIFISQANLSYFFSNDFDESEIFFVKYWIFFVIGLLLGSAVYLLVDDIFSNNDLNDWAWKVIYLILFSLAFVLNIFLKFKNQTISIEANFEDQRALKSSYNDSFLIVRNMSIMIPIFLFVIFSASHWLPKFSNPENMQFLDFNLINLFIILLATLFVYPLVFLIGKRKTSSFFIISILFLSLFACFFDYSSSYSIDLLKFFLSIVSSFSICLYYLDSKIISEFNPFQKIRVFNSFLMIISFLVPVSFYYFINFSISYNIVYLIIFLIYLFSFLMGIYGKKNI